MAGRIREADVATVRERNRVDEVVGEYVSLRRAGGGALKGLCPFHDEKSPSFNVRPSHGTFHCFGCGEGGDVIAFVMKIEHLGFVESVERLADRTGIQLNYEGGGPNIGRDRGTRNRMLEAHRAAAEFYGEQLATPDAAQAREYLAERGFDEAAARAYGCGFAPAGWDRLTKHLLGRGFELDELQKAQLSKEGQQGRPTDRFHRRLLWPLKDLGGNIVGFGARRLFDDDRIQAKYLNTSESPVFKKSQVLFGIDKAKSEIAKRRQAVVVEGYTDVMAMHASGVPTAVASCGTAFGDDHMSVLRRLMLDDEFSWGEVIFTFDGDDAGQKAAIKAFDGDQTFVAQTYIAVAPDGMDPCELRQAKGEVAVRDLVARRVPLIEFYIRSVLKAYDLNSVDGQVAALQHTVPLVARIKDRASRDGYAAKLAWWVGWADESMVVRRVRESTGELPTSGRRPRRAQQPDPNQPALAVDTGGLIRPDPRDHRLQAQRDVLKAALQLPALAGPVYDALPDDAFPNPAYLAVHRAILKAGGTATGLSGTDLVQAVIERCEHQSVRVLVSELAVESMPTKDEVDTRFVSAVLAGLQREQVGRQIAELKGRLQRLNPITNADEYRAAWGDLVAFEEYHRALVRQASGAFE